MSKMGDYNIDQMNKRKQITLDENEQAELLEILEHAEAGIGEFECVNFTSDEANEKQKMVARWKNKIEQKPGQWFVAIHLTENCSDPLTAEAIKQGLSEMLARADIAYWQITNVEKLPK